jgi:hypothetical protein
MIQLIFKSLNTWFIDPEVNDNTNIIGVSFISEVVSIKDTMVVVIIIIIIIITVI